MAKSKEGSLSLAEVALMKAMLRRGTFHNDEIAAYFNHPKRTLNQGRVADCKTGRRWADVESASDEELDRFLALWHDSTPAPAAASAALGPVHPSKLRQLFPLDPAKPGHLAVDEGDWIEFKLAYNKKARSKYAKSMAGLANNAGGYLLFGVEDATKRIEGIDEAHWEGLDPRGISQFLGQNFAPTPAFSKGKVTVAGKVVGVLHTQRAEDKPIVCLVNDGDLDNGAIYYRYSGETRAVRAPELLAILRGRDHRADERMASMVQRIQRIGAGSVALLDLENGTIDGQRGQFLLPPELLPHLRVIREGHFEEKEGAPALRLLGDLEVAGAEVVAVRRENLTDEAVIEDFLRQTPVENPKDYLRYLAHSSAIWLPAFYYARLARLSDAEAATLVARERKSAKKRATEQAERIRKHSLPKLSAKHRRESVAKELASLAAGEDVDLAEGGAMLRFLKAATLVERDEVQLALLLQPLLHIFQERYQSLKNYPLQLFRNAVVRTDILFFAEPAVAERAKAPVPADQDA